MGAFRKVIVIGLDGLEPTIVDAMLERGELPNLANLRSAGGYSRVATTYPAQTPVAWSTFATGVNPGGHGIFDFIRRDPKTYLPDLALNRYEQKNAFVMPKAVNLRRGVTVWELLRDAGVAATVIRCPCTYPPDNVKGRMLSGMGVPDVRGGLGTGTFYSSAVDVEACENENLVRIQVEGGKINTYLIGPRNPKTREDIRFEITVQQQAGKVIVRSAGEPRELIVNEREWSGWLKVKFKAGLFQSARGMVRFYLVRQSPALELYASPVNFDPQAPLFAISSPAEYAKELEQKFGTFYTTGMVEDHNALSNARIDEAGYMQQCEIVLREREQMLMYELGRQNDGLIFCLFDTPDRVQHMFWRFREANHPANREGMASGMERVIEDHYRRCDAIVGKAVQYADEQTLFIVLSDHGFNSFQRGVNLNTWLCEQGLMTLKNGARPGESAGDLFENVDWGQTKAYALGLSGIYLNLKGREADGIVEADEATKLQARISAGLSDLKDEERNSGAIRSAVARQQVYGGPFASEAPDVIVNFAKGYRVSWATALGGIPTGYTEDNSERWSGDHIVDPSLVPGVLFMNKAFRGENARLLDLAPTILAALGAPKGSAMEGQPLVNS